MARPEEQLHFQVATYLKMRYPKVIFLSEASGARVSMGLALKLKKMRSAHTHLDVYILQPKLVQNEQLYCGLILELKAKNIFKKDGTLLKSDHLDDQQKTIDLLNERGYMACFACGFDEAKKIIDNYLN